MSRYILFLLFIACPLWAMDDESTSDSGSVVSLGEFPKFTAEDFEPLEKFKERRKKEMEEDLQSYRSSLPELLKPGLPRLEPFVEEDYNDLVDEEGQPIDTQAAFDQFKEIGPETPKYQTLQRAFERKKEARLERQAGELVVQQANGAIELEKISSEENNDVESSSSSDEETSTVMDWDVVEKITKKAKQKPNPTEWISNIDWASLETSPVVSPSKRPSLNPL